LGFLDRFSRSARRYISPDDNQRIVAAIRNAERRTSGEIRVYLESKCRYVNPIDRAAELFFGLRMEQTAQRNAVLVYVAFQDHQFAIFADQGIYTALGSDYWDHEARKMLQHFRQHDYADGLVAVIADIGEALAEHFPYDRQNDKNELPDDIVFGN
jgi:uncharacterized membrane protein